MRLLRWTATSCDDSEHLKAKVFHIAGPLGSLQAVAELMICMCMSGLARDLFVSFHRLSWFPV